MTIKNNNGKIIGFHTADDVRIISADTFGEMRKMSDNVYHDCKETDKGTCMVIVTQNFDNHIYPKDSIIIF